MEGYLGECGKTGSIREYCVGEGDQEGSGPTNNCKEEDSRESGGRGGIVVSQRLYAKIMLEEHWREG